LTNICSHIALEPAYIQPLRTYEGLGFVNSIGHYLKHAIFSFAISHRVQDKKGSGESNPRKPPRKVKHHYNNKTTH